MALDKWCHPNCLRHPRRRSAGRGAPDGTSGASNLNCDAYSCVLNCMLLSLYVVTIVVCLFVLVVVCVCVFMCIVISMHVIVIIVIARCRSGRSGRR